MTTTVLLWHITTRSKRRAVLCGFFISPLGRKLACSNVASISCLYRIYILSYDDVSSHNSTLVFMVFLSRNKFNAPRASQPLTIVFIVPSIHVGTSKRCWSVLYMKNIVDDTDRYYLHAA